MLGDNLCRLYRDIGHRLNHFLTVFHVAPYLFHLLRGQGSFFVDQFLRQTELADIMEQGTRGHIHQLLLIQFELFTHGNHHNHYIYRVGKSVFIHPADGHQREHGVLVAGN